MGYQPTASDSGRIDGSLGDGGTDLPADTNPTLRTDGLGMTVSRIFGPGGRDLYETTRPALGDMWGTLVARTELDTTSVESGGMLALGGTLIVFASEWISEDARLLVFVRGGDLFETSR